MDELLRQIEAALRNAHAAGDTERARRLAAELIHVRDGTAADFSNVQSGSSSRPILSQPAGAAAAPPMSMQGDVIGADPNDPRARGRAFAAQEVGPVDAAAQGAGSFLFGVGTPLTAASQVAVSHLDPRREPVRPGEAMEFARGIREQSYVDHPGAYRVGAASGVASGIGAVRGAVALAPAAARGVFGLQSGQTKRNLLKLAAAGGAASGVTAASEQGAGAAPMATAVGAVAGPAVGMVGGAIGSGLARMSANSAAIRALARAAGESAEVLAERYNAFVATMGRAPRLVEIMTKRGSEELGEIGRSKVGVQAGRVFREAEEAAALSRPSEMAPLMRGAPGTTPAATSSVAAQRDVQTSLQGAAAARAAREMRPAVRVQTKHQKDAFDAVMGKPATATSPAVPGIGTHMVPVTNAMRDVVENPDVMGSLDGALRRQVQRMIQAGEDLGTISFPVRTWDMIRRTLGDKAEKMPAGSIYAQHRDKVRSHVGGIVREYEDALREFGVRGDVISGTVAGRKLISEPTEDFVARIATSDRAVNQGHQFGARQRIVAALSGTPKQAEAFMTRLSRDESLRRSVRAALNPGEVEGLERLAAAYGRRLDMAAGVQQGRRVLRGGDTEAFQDAVTAAQRSGPGEVGVAAGARSALTDAAGESPGYAAGLAQGLAENQGLQQRIASALGGGEAARLQRVGAAAHRSAQNLAAATPRLTEAQHRNQAAAQQIQEIITGGVVMTGRASGALRANLFNNMVQRARMSARAAERVAKLATDPDRAHEAIELLRRRGMRDEQILQIYRDAAVAAGIAIGGID